MGEDEFLLQRYTLIKFERNFMSRFGEGDYFGDDDNQYDYNNEEYPEEEFDGAGAMMGAGVPLELISFWKRQEVALESKKINIVVLKKVINMLESSWLWRFYPLKKRVAMVYDSYVAMVDLISNEEA